MINIVKSMPPPKCLEEEKKKAKGDYKCGDVLERIKNDFKNKCYLCEYKAPPSINVEHFVPHKGDIGLKFDWSNLFWACAHCNNVKGDRFNNILNCTNPAHDVENCIRYELKHFPKEEVKITALKNDELVENTVQLLLEIYNGTTQLKTIESDNIRKILQKEILTFQTLLWDYIYEDVEDDVKKIYLKKITAHLNKTSAFTAFKRWIIKKNPDLKQEFEQYFD
jgi:hypothetical protein